MSLHCLYSRITDGGKDDSLTRRPCCTHHKYLLGLSLEGLGQMIILKWFLNKGVQLREVRRSCLGTRSNVSL
jgi:hypothetical protein